jgi:hypothetical protein
MENPTMSTTTVSCPADLLREELHREGYLQGTPPCAGLLSVLVDRIITHRRICAACGRHGMTFLSFYNASSYRGLAVCRCGHGEEV